MAVIQMVWTSSSFPQGVKETYTVPGDIDHQNAEKFSRDILNFYNETLRPGDCRREFVDAEVLPDTHPDALNAYALYLEINPADEPEVDPADEPDEDEDDVDDEEIFSLYFEDSLYDELKDTD